MKDLKYSIDKCKLYIDFMIANRQWSALSKNAIDLWLRNFENCTDEEYSIVYKLLKNLIYFSEDDLIDMLYEGIRKLYHNSILEAQIISDFQLSNNALRCIINQEKDQTLFVPLLDSDSPHESANYILRLMVTRNIIQDGRSVSYNKIEEFYSDSIKQIVIVDDCLGSGDQLYDFWNNFEINEHKTFRDFCKEKNIKVTYLVLFGYDDNINKLKKTFDDLTIQCVRLLTKHQRVFQDNSYIWENVEEREFAKNFLKDIAEENGFGLLGYNELDFAFVMHSTIPDWSLPVFWKERESWSPLLRRKNSRV